MMASWWVAAREARGSARMLLLSILAMAGIAYLMASSYPDFVERFSAVQHGPRIFRRMVASRTSPEAYLGFTYIHPVAFLLLSAWPVTRAAQGLAGAIDRGNLGWRLALPMSRSAYFWGQAAWMLAGTVLLAGALVAGLVAGCWRHDVVVAGWGRYAIAAGAESLRYGAVGALALWVSAATSRAAVPAMAGTAIVIGSVILENVGGPLKLLDGYQWLSLFHYAHGPRILEAGTVPPRDVAVLAGVLVTGLLGAWITFRRRDLSI